MRERHPIEKVLAEFKRLYGDVCLDLGREDKVEGRGFVDALLDTEPNEFGVRFRAAFLDHTGGHPLFAIELLRDLQERGDLIRNERAAWVEGPALSWHLLPARVEGVIEERIGRLEEDLRAALTVASVEGEEFTAQVVARVQEVQERRLLRRLSQELEKRHRLVRELGEERVGHRLLSRYRFAHALFQQYLYNDLSLGERRLLHGEVARALAELFEEAVEEIAVQLAFHYRRAGLEEQALPHLIRAGHQARAKFANDEAVGYYSEALRTVPEDGPERFDLLACRAAVYDLIARRDEQRADVEEMLDLAEELGDDARLCDALLALADYYTETRYLDAQEPGEKALALARSLGDPEREGQALQRLGYLSWNKGDYHRSREELEAAVGLFMDAGLLGEAASSLHMLSLPLKPLHEFGPAMEAAKKSVALSQAAGDRRQEAIALRRLAITHGPLRAAEALPYVQRALALHREVGDRSEEMNALNVLGFGMAHLGEYAEAERCFRESLHIAESIGASILTSYAVSNLVQYHYERRGDFEGSLQFLDVRLEHALAEEDDWLVADVRHEQGHSLMNLGQYDHAHRALATASRLMEKLGDSDSALYARTWRGLVEAYLGDYESSAETLQSAVEGATEGSNEGLQTYAVVLRGFAGLLEGRPQTLRAGLEQVLEGLELIPDEEFYEKGASYEIAAALHLALGEIDSAMGCSIEGLRMMEMDPAPRWPERRHFTHSRILRALGREAEADEHLKQAYERVMLVVGNTQDQELRRSWLENVDVNREILAACAQRGIGPEELECPALAFRA
jgi:tetratricopeptide (TPR) repeat protein